MSHIKNYFKEVEEIANKINIDEMEKMIKLLCNLRECKGRLFIIGVGGSAANCIHAVNDFRKLAHIETYSPAENIAELTARTNDEGWHTVFSEWLKISQLTKKDAILVFSVGGGDKEKNVSANIVYALEYAKDIGASVMGIVGRQGGFTASVADACVVVPVVNEANITPHTEAFHAVVWHGIVSDPRIMQIKNKWESITPSR